MPERFVLVLAGGIGERFWPWSQPDRPKQLLPLASGGRTLLSATLDRAFKVASPDHVVVLTSRNLKEAVRRECGATGVRILGEPMMRNTAAAIGAAAALFAGQAPDPAFVVMPADHAIDDIDAFTADLDEALAVAERDSVLVTFGIKPTAPETHFGYIRRGAALGGRWYRVAEFTEKPDLARAAAWLDGGEHAWNSGIFVWRSSTLFAGLERGRPAMVGPLRSLVWNGSDERFEHDLEGVFPGIESVSVDYAVLEHADNVQMMEASFDWDDLGSWSSWARRQAKDENGNVLFGDALALDCRDCVVVGADGTAAAMGLTDMVVVRAAGATMACRLSETDQVRRLAKARAARTS